MVRLWPNRGNGAASTHDAQTRLYQPVRQSLPEDPTDQFPLPTYGPHLSYFQEVHGSNTSNRTFRAARTAAVLQWLFIVVELLVGIRFLLRLLAAGPQAIFTAVVYAMSAPFVAPFIGVLPSPTLGPSTIELPALLAIGVYILAGMLVIRLVRILFIDEPRLP